MQDFPGYQGPMVYWPQVKIIEGVEKALKAIRLELICCLASNAGDSDAAMMGLALEPRAPIHFRRRLLINLI